MQLTINRLILLVNSVKINSLVLPYRYISRMSALIFLGAGKRSVTGVKVRN